MQNYNTTSRYLFISYFLQKCLFIYQKHPVFCNNVIVVRPHETLVVEQYTQGANFVQLLCHFRSLRYMQCFDGALVVWWCIATCISMGITNRYISLSYITPAMQRVQNHLPSRHSMTVVIE